MILNKKDFESHNEKTRVGQRKKDESFGWSETQFFFGIISF